MNVLLLLSIYISLYCYLLSQVSKLVCNITQSEPVVITARKIEENIKLFLPQVTGHTLK